MAGRQEQIKQIWLTSEDDALFEKVASALKGQGIDVESDHRRSRSPYSHTKVFRHLLRQAAQQLHQAG